MPIEVLMPPLSQTLDTLVLVEWLKHEGETVTKGEPLFLVESDKATLEVEAPATGILSQILALSCAEVQVKTPIALIVAHGETHAAHTPDEGKAPGPATHGPAPALRRSLEPLPPARLQRIPASPRARARAQREGIDLAALSASGAEGMIVGRAVTAYLAAQLETARVSPVAQRMAAAEGVDVAALAQARPGQRITRADVAAAAVAEANTAPPAGQRLSPMRRAIAERLHTGYQATVPVTLIREVDATELVELRARVRKDLADADVHPTFTDFFALIVAHCLPRHPALNGTFDGAELVLAEAVHLALAVDTPRGLAAPVLRPADLAGLLTIARRRAELVQSAAASRLTPQELAGGTFTLTNLGALGVDAFTPVINPPQIAILGTGRIREAPAVHRGQLAVRQLLVLSLTFDHRLVDGAPAARFLDDAAQFIEKPHRIWYA